MRPLAFAVGLVCCAGLASPARGDDAVKPARPAASSHDAILKLAAERNLGLLARGLDRTSATAAADAARRPYLPEVALEAASRTTMAKQTRSVVEWLPTISYTSPIGTIVSAQARLVDGVSGNPETERALTIEVSQAVLRKGLYSGARSGLRQADLDVQLARESFRIELNALLVRTDRAYWELAFARDDLDIKRRSRDRAKSQFEETKENIRRGLLAPGEIYIVEESLVDFEERQNRAEESLTLAESALRRILSVPPGAPVAAFFDDDAKAGTELSEAESLGISATKNPTVLAAKLSAERARIGVEGDTGEALPQLDAFGRWTTRSGRDELDKLLPSEPEIRAGVRLSVPVYWGPDVARVRRARTELLQRRLELHDAEESVAASVRDAATRLRARRQRVDLAARIVGLSQSKLDVEREKYKSGVSTLADVVRFQRELDAALSGALRARVDLLEARAELFAARGDLHERAKVAVQ